MLELLRGAENIELLEIDCALLLQLPNEFLAGIAEFARIIPAEIDKMLPPSLAAERCWGTAAATSAQIDQLHHPS